MSAAQGKLMYRIEAEHVAWQNVIYLIRSIVIVIVMLGYSHPCKAVGPYCLACYFTITKYSQILSCPHSHLKWSFTNKPQVWLPNTACWGWGLAGLTCVKFSFLIRSHNGYVYECTVCASVRSAQCTHNSPRVDIIIITLCRLWAVRSPSSITL